ncbi:topoisomerase DNA-binding C4 zinc finger domain-containing protein, partial [Candidatus Uhrbacteria bacterium]|nr:topoisomerase DNA-binding C4 zinc finger domain-containing protein [Candidatus Uhrbacteria bacterium]
VIRDFYGPFKENLLVKEKEINKKDFTETATDEKCEKCSSAMVEKLGRFGKFLACSNYPECKNTKNIASDSVNKDGSHHPVAEETKEVCDKCQSPMIIKVGKFGKFLACSKYPECKNVKSIINSTGVKCAECEKGDIAERRSKRGKIFYSCSRYPDCKFALWNKPTGAKCPQCKSLLVFYGKDNKVKCSSQPCGYKET